MFVEAAAGVAARPRYASPGTPRAPRWRGPRARDARGQSATGTGWLETKTSPASYALFAARSRR
ncbi:MAG: hypothetical protein QOC64_3888 [Solirubrobacteraceae bacterium]|nr:hypothetical protein [Solirubrobacteraceae bacterium]